MARHGRPLLPRTPRDVFRFRPHERFLYDGGVALLALTGLWRRPIRASGDLEEMGFLDKLYWVYKCQHPIRRAPRGSGLEAHFERARAHRWALPDGFRPERTLRLSAVGDLMNHAFLAGSGETLYREVEGLIFDVDVAMANLECVVMDGATGELELTTSSGPPLHFDGRELDVVGGRFSFLAAACNHSLDFGPEGVDATIAALRTRGIAFHGVNEREEDAAAATILERNGIRLGVVSFCFGLNAHRPPPGRPRIVNRMRLNGRPAEIDFAPIEAQLAHCRAEGVDFVVAQLHWGMEFEHYPRPEQLEVARHLAELGVDAIVGHHPHVPQPFEAIRTARDPDRFVPVFYSLGNLTNPWSADFLCRSLVARIELARGTLPDGTTRTYVARAGAEEVVQVADPVRRTIALRPAG